MADQDQPQAAPSSDAETQAAIAAQREKDRRHSKFVDNGMEFMGFEDREGNPIHVHEGQYQKMRAAETGGAGPGLAPTEAEQSLERQQAVLQQRAATQGAQQAQQAQQQSQAPQPPPAPSSPQGVTQPYPAQAGQEEEK